WHAPFTLASRLLGASRTSEALQRSTDHTRRGRGRAAASGFFRNPYSLVGREGSLCSDTYHLKALLIDAKHPPVLPLAVAPPQPELVSPVLCQRWEVLHDEHGVWLFRLEQQDATRTAISLITAEGHRTRLGSRDQREGLALKGQVALHILPALVH